MVLRNYVFSQPFLLPAGVATPWEREHLEEVAAADEGAGTTCNLWLRTKALCEELDLSIDRGVLQQGHAINAALGVLLRRRPCALVVQRHGVTRCGATMAMMCNARRRMHPGPEVTGNMLLLCAGFCQGWLVYSTNYAHC